MTPIKFEFQVTKEYFFSAQICPHTKFETY